MWFARSAANRLSRAALRCMPILLAAAFVPRPYGLSLPASPMQFFPFSYNIVYRACGDGVVQHADLHADLFYDFSAGSADPFYVLRGIPCRRDRADPFFSRRRSGESWSFCPSRPCRMFPCGSTAGGMSPGGDGAGGGAADCVADRNYGSWKMAVLDGGPAAGDRTGRVMG